MKMSLFLLLVCLFTAKAFSQITRNGMELDSAVIWADSPKDSIDFENIMNEQYPDVGVFAACMSVMSDDLGYTAPEVVMMNSDFETILYINICKPRSLSFIIDSSRHQNNLPECLFELNSIYQKQIVNNGFGNFMRYSLLNDTAIINENISKYNKILEQYGRKPVSADSLIIFFDYIRNIKNCDTKQLIELIQYSDSSKYREMAMYLLSDELNNEVVMAAFLVNILTKYDYTAMSYIQTHFNNLPNDSYIIQDKKLASLFKFLLQVPKSNILQLANSVFPKIKDINTVLGKVTKSDLSSIRKYLELKIFKSGLEGIFSSLLKVNFNSSEEYIDYIDKMDK